MTEQEAIETLKGNYPKTCKMVNGRLQGGFDDLECKLGQAITIGIAAIEKQVAEIPIIEGDGYTDDGQILCDTWICPNCGTYYEIDYDEYNYCPKCGQHIERVWEDWSEKE